MEAAGKSTKRKLQIGTDESPSVDAFITFGQHNGQWMISVMRPRGAILSTQVTHKTEFIGGREALSWTIWGQIARYQGKREREHTLFLDCSAPQQLYAICGAQLPDCKCKINPGYSCS